MEFEGKVFQILDIVSGNSQNGTWKRQDFVLEIQGQYPRKVCFTVFGDKIDQFNLKVGEDIRVEADIESREYNGKWFTSVKAWKMQKTNNEFGDVLPNDDISQNFVGDGIDLSAKDEDDFPF